MRRRFSIGLAAALSVAALTITSVRDAYAQQPIKIAFLSSLSGPFTPWGINVRDGMKLAIAEVNAAGGVNGRPIVLVERDDRNNANEGVTAFKYLVEREGIVAAGGVISSDVGLAVSREAEAQKVPLFLTMSGAHEILTKDSRYTFRTCLPAAPMSMAYIAGLIKEKKYTRVAVISADYAWGHAVRESVEKHIKPLPGVKLQIEVAPVPERDFTPYLRKLQAMDPEILIATGHPPGQATIMRQAIELGLKGPIIGPWYPTEFTVERVGELMFGRFVDYSCADFDSASLPESRRKIPRAEQAPARQQRALRLRDREDRRRCDGGRKERRSEGARLRGPRRPLPDRRLRLAPLLHRVGRDEGSRADPVLVREGRAPGR